MAIDSMLGQRWIRMRRIASLAAICWSLVGCQNSTSPAPPSPDGRLDESSQTSPVDEVTSELPAASQETDIQQSGTEPFHVTGDVVPPTQVSTTQPMLESLTGRWVQGVCVLSAVISREGEVEGIEVAKPDDLDPETGRLLVDVLGSWHFEPATFKGEPVAVYYTVTVDHCPVKRVSGAVQPSAAMDGAVPKLDPPV